MMISTFVRLILSVRYVAFEGVASSTLAFLYFPEPSFYAALTLREDFLATAHRPPRPPKSPRAIPRNSPANVANSYDNLGCRMRQSCLFSTLLSPRSQVLAFEFFHNGHRRVPY